MHVLRAFACRFGAAFLLAACLQFAIACAGTASGVRPTPDPSLELRAVAGEYGWFAGSTGSELTIRPDATFVWEWHRYWSRYPSDQDNSEAAGRVEVRDDVVHLVRTADDPCTATGSVALPTQLVVVPWGPRRYLIEPARLSEFCRAVTDGIAMAPSPKLRDIIGAEFLHTRSAPERLVWDLPAVPAAFRNELPPGPAVGRVIEVGASGEVARVDIGLGDGVEAGMIFECVDGTRLVVVAVFEDEIVVRFGIILAMGEPRHEPFKRGELIRVVLDSND